jgi:hypothetical protein
MASNLPYLVSSGTLTKILNKICDASIPENFNGDFLATKLGFPGGHQKVFIPWAKKCKLIGDDGTPTQLYKDFRNPIFRGVAMAIALKKGYEELYLRNESAHDLSRADFTKLVTDTTGIAHDNQIVKAIVGTFFNAKEFADFEANSNDQISENVNDTNNFQKSEIETNEHIQKTVRKKQVELGINYTINLVLPKTDDPAIYNAIFKSLRDNLLND